jgi:hypothetical protein
VGKPEESRRLGKLGTDGRIILKWVFEKWFGDMDWIHVAQDRYRRRAVVNAVLNLQDP